MAEIITAGGEVIQLPATAVAQRADPAPLSLIHGALEKGITDPGYLQKLLDLQERWEDRQAQAEYNRCLNAAQAEMPAIYKDGENRFNKTRYATLEGVLRAVQPVYLRHGFTLSFGQEPGDPAGGMLRVYVDVAHVAGHTRRYYGDFPVDAGGMKGGDNKTAIQAVGSAFSYARRYLMGLVFNLVFTNEDNDGQPVGGGQDRRQEAPSGVNSGRVVPTSSGPPIDRRQFGTLAALMQAIKTNGRADIEQEVCQRYGVRDLTELPAAKFDAAKKALEGTFSQMARQGAGAAS